MTEEKPKRILVVDDQDNWRLALRVLLEGEGYQIEEAGTFQQAKNSLASAQYDLVVLDVRLVDEQIFNVQGLELLQDIKQRSPLTKTIIITGYPKDVESASNEANAMFFKGVRFEPKEFKRQVNELLHARTEQ